MSALTGQQIDGRALGLTDASYVASGGMVIGVRALGLSIMLTDDSPWIAIHAGLTSTEQLRELGGALLTIADRVEGQDFSTDPAESAGDILAAAQALAELRRQAGLSIAAAASIAGVSSGYMERVEIGAASPTASWLARVSARLAERV